MQTDASTGHECTARLQAYQEACNRQDIEAALALFNEDALLEVDGEQIRGQAALRAAHEWDQGANNQIALYDWAEVRDVVRCTFANCHELHRMLGIDAIHRRAEVRFEHGRIQTFVLSPPDEHDLQRFRHLAGPFFTWAREHHPKELAKVRTLNAAGGAALFTLAHAWRANQQRGIQASSRDS